MLCGILLGVTPGIGGSQRVTRAIGKAKAMELCLTGRMMNADEAERAGLVSRIVPADTLLKEARAAPTLSAACRRPPP
jgi:enoyl-CoA hydratase